VETDTAAGVVVSWGQFAPITPLFVVFGLSMASAKSTTALRMSIWLGVPLLPVGLLQRTRWLPFYRRMHDLDEALFGLIEKRRQEPVAERGETVVADLLAASHEDGEPLSNQEIRDALVTNADSDPGKI